MLSVVYLFQPTINLRLAYDDQVKLKIFLGNGLPPISINVPRLVMNSNALRTAKLALIDTLGPIQEIDMKHVGEIEQNGFFLPVRQVGEKWYMVLNRAPT